jgi:hypothetical protein
MIAKCTPDLETIFKEGMLDGWLLENGGHGLFWGNKSRVACVLSHVGKAPGEGRDVNIPLNRGLGYVQWQGQDKPGITHQVEKGKAYPWMSPEGYDATMKHLAAMSRMTFQDVSKVMNISLQEWLEQRDLPQESYDYIKVLAASQTVQAEPAMTPAGDFLAFMAIAKDIDMNLVSGSVGCAQMPGPISIVKALEEVVLQNGGEIRRNTPVREVLMKGNKVTGVEYEGETGRGEILTDNVICTIPSKYLFKVLPRDPFPSDWVETLEKKHWGAGILTGWGSFKRPIWKDAGLEPSSFIYMPAILREGYIGAVDMIMTEITAWGDGTAKRGPEGKHDFVFSTALTDKEMRDPSKLGPVIETCEAWARSTFPTWDEDMDFFMWTPSPEGYGIWRPVGEERPDVKSPWVAGLFLAGDQYGKRLWGAGVDAAALSGVMCVDAIEASNLEEAVFPPWHRGLPEGY